jgi:hypothetical protein
VRACVVGCVWLFGTITAEVLLAFMRVRSSYLRAHSPIASPELLASPFAHCLPHSPRYVIKLSLPDAGAAHREDGVLSVARGVIFCVFLVVVVRESSSSSWSTSSSLAAPQLE